MDNKMKKLLLCKTLMFLLTLSIIQNVYAADIKPTVAIMDFESVGSEEHLGKAVAEIIRTELINAGQFRVLERSQLYRALSEQKLQNSGIIDNKSVVEMGKLLGANFIIIGSVVKMGTAYTINSRMIDIKTGEATLGRNVKGNDLNLLADLSRALLESLFGSSAKLKVSPIFEEHFKDNIHGWYLVNDQDKRFEIVSGKYIIESKRGGSWITSRRIPLNQSADFQIDMTVQKISGTDDYGFGMIYGEKNVNNAYIFVITGSGFFIHERIEDNKPERILSKFVDSINKGSGSSNALSLRKSGNHLEFYINNKLVGKTSFSPLFGDYSGCIVYSGNNAIIVGFSDIYVYGQ
ncbi:MAG: CsgG/HfaB family protein [Syntrophales bacterium]|jgi:TolB-like protein|nr:CsgG/HfaB family protein [Syntrophales bacterium]MCK9391017.1 CsgG/HfaB family protein [Syntrophales bacterium]